MTYLLAGLLTFPITAALTIAGVGAAFVLIPVFTTIGIDIHQAMAVALLLNALAMIAASIRYARKKLVLWKLSLPLIVTTVVGAPIGVRLGYMIDNLVLRVIFIAFLLFAASMIIFAKGKTEDDGDADDGVVKLTVGRAFIAAGAGLAVGVLAGLIGVGGGNIILPILVALGIRPRQAVGTTAVVVVSLSLSGFVSHLEVGELDYVFVLITASASIAGAIIGSWLMTVKLKPIMIKRILGVVLVGLAIKMIVNLF